MERFINSNEHAAGDETATASVPSGGIEPRRPEQESAEPTPEGDLPAMPRIYVASLADYNAGRLHGTWIEAAREPSDLWADISAMLAGSTEPLAEEWAIHDYDNFGHVRLSEYESIERVSLLARGIAECGEPFAAWWATAEQDGDNLTELVNAFEEVYRGEWESARDYADSLLDDLGATESLAAVPDWLQPYVSLDIERFARDLELSGDIHTARSGQGGTFVFDRE